MPWRLSICLSLLIGTACVSSAETANSVETPKGEGWKLLFNGKNLEGWNVVLRNARSEDPDHLVQVHDGAVHMYREPSQGSTQAFGYIVTEKEYSNYHLRFEYKWGTKKFAPRAKGKRDAGLLYHVSGKDGVWPRSVECQIQEGDVGDIFTVSTRIVALVDPKTTNTILNLTTNDAGVVRTNEVLQPHFLDPKMGGVPLLHGIASGIRRVIRNPMNEREGWNQVEVIVSGDSAIHIINGKVNNRATEMKQMVDGQWVPLNQGKIALQLEGAEVFYRKIEIKHLSP
jgi:hypothetical protein